MSERRKEKIYNKWRKNAHKQMQERVLGINSEEPKTKNDIKLICDSNTTSTLTIVPFFSVRGSRMPRLWPLRRSFEFAEANIFRNSTSAWRRPPRGERWVERETSANDDKNPGDFSRFGIPPLKTNLTLFFMRLSPNGVRFEEQFEKSSDLPHNFGVWLRSWNFDRRPTNAARDYR